MVLAENLKLELGGMTNILYRCIFIYIYVYYEGFTVFNGVFSPCMSGC